MILKLCLLEKEVIAIAFPRQLSSILRLKRLKKTVEVEKTVQMLI